MIPAANSLSAQAARRRPVVDRRQSLPRGGVDFVRQDLPLLDLIQKHADPFGTTHDRGQYLRPERGAKTFPVRHQKCGDVRLLLSGQASNRGRLHFARHLRDEQLADVGQVARTRRRVILVDDIRAETDELVADSELSPRVRHDLRRVSGSIRRSEFR